MPRIAVIINHQAGSTGEIGTTQIEDALRAAGFESSVTLASDGSKIVDAAKQALSEGADIVVAGGGDGTVSAVASELVGSGIALGVLPLGTLNHFAKDLGIPLDPAEAVRVIAAGRRVGVDVGEVNGRGFINNASLGLYPNIVRERARQQRRLGRSKRMAMLWATLEAFHRSRLLDVRLELEGRVHEFRAPFLFVGNNDYILEGFDIGSRVRLDGGVLNVYATRATSTARLFGLALRALFGRLRQAEDFVEASARSLRVASRRRRRLLVAIDGEPNVLDSPLEFSIRPRALQVIVP